ncbi:Hypothetical predicted protein [Lecanosticta acicola]|uniref:D-serine dehydratase n=1 Tax=Lecanosticta acicola TaxID=111012 RepID=A0AAI9EC48_9PEZI|nr:Hypothetical predicted protein [Lecanosticta acicola]
MAAAAATAAAYMATSLYPQPSAANLKLQFLGKQIREIQAPAAILDVAVIRRNCRLMLESCEKLGVGFRTHVKTHKTTELTELQVGKGSKTVNLVASTVSEIENLVPWLLECKSQGKGINILYGLPVSPSAILRLAAIARVLGQGSVGLFVDHVTHIRLLENIDDTVWPGRIPVWVQVDVGYHREGVASDSRQLAEIAEALSGSRKTVLGGMYTHMGHSYGVSSPEEAVKFMSEELSGLREGAVNFLKAAGAGGSSSKKVVLSLGATPTATSIQNLLHETESGKEYRDMLDKCRKSFTVEVHAGVYPVMDMQQLATRARPVHAANAPDQSLLSFKDLGLRILTEVASVYPDRNEKPEALIAAGSLVLGREPCKSYPGWGVVSPWPMNSTEFYDPEGSKTGWIVGRVSQEHGNLTWEGSQENVRQLQIGEKLLVWPNHACIAGAHFGWYLVVDSEKLDPERVEDVWVRWRGW